MRLDKFLWSVRLFKTRSIATDECKKSRVKVNGLIAKPSKEINNSDIIEIKYHFYTKTIRIINIPTQRVSAKLVNDFILDITPVDEYAKLDMMRENTQSYKPKWKGRPTKKDRRNIDEFFTNLPEN
ncbi:MAG: RNA-binding S4 domain-containing protein [Bacteroidales bacterium]|jgi:ribosome-associated heat shock protein Hsp15|nr:RNA-binding S4 domain-containing protein [Bacteroidales bacterium]MDI3480276.1 ribosome-associated heat shock protein Hsp15 [Rikenellaceae bacterium]MDI3545003.1 ribosome-associated heat shock protein Hsp15 [Rikenellaceae bacterium]